MPLQPHPDLIPTVDILKEAFESGRSVALKVSFREEPLNGCVSQVHEGADRGSYVFSAVVGWERIVIGDAEAEAG